MTVQRCTDCGYTWAQGTDGRHRCKARIMEQRNLAEREASNLRNAVEAMRVAGGRQEFQDAFDRAKELIS